MIATVAVVNRDVAPDNVSPLPPVKVAVIPSVL
jgi:hypothetical protein